MALRSTSSAVVLAVLIGCGCAQAQSLTEELSITAGASTEEVGAVGTQVRAFGELESHVRFYFEGSWASRSDVETDAFGAAYPYDNRFRLMEAYAERIALRDRWLAGVRVGRYRTPFGISGRSDHAYSGFLRAPLIRYDNYFGVSNNFLEGGVDVVVGRPSINVEVSLGVPQDVGEAIRESGLDRVVRVQAYRGSLLVGASYIGSKRYDRRPFARGNLQFTGVDARWMAHGIQVRGELITGQPFDDVSTTGWYVDGSIHRVAMGPVTLVARAENLEYEAGHFSRYGRRFTAGTRIQLTNSLVGQINLLRQPLDMVESARTAFDVGLTYVVRHPW